MSLLTNKEDRKYINVLGSDGTLRMVVPEGTPNSQIRSYETSDGKKGVKHELVFSKIEGLIVNLAICPGDYGKQLHITVENGDEQAILSLGTETSFGESFMKLLPNINLEESASFEPYSFENDKGKTIKGISIKQNGEKIQNYYWDADAKKPLHGFPKPKGDTEAYDTNDWKIFFLEARKFLVGETEKLIAEKFPAKAAEAETHPEDEIAPEKIPF